LDFISVATSVKYGKVAIVVFITILIWVWADLAQDEKFTVPHATITIAKSVEPGLLVTFGEASSVDIDDIVLKGPASRIADAERDIMVGRLSFVFYLDPAQEEAMTDPGKHSLDIHYFLRKSKLIRDRGLTVESCSPKSVLVSVAKLIEKPLKVRCMDEDGILIKDATVDPTHVKMFVPEDWAGGTLVANVHLTPREIEQARAGVVNGTPQIELPLDSIRKAGTTVEIRMPPEEITLPPHTITAANLAVALSVNLLEGNYKVEVTNLAEVVRPFTIRATLEAKEAYESQPFQMTLYILDGDEKIEGEQPRDVVYNLPEEFVREDQIMPPPVPAQVRFKLIRLDSAKGSSAGGS
jgi:hypothetical protein